MTLGCPGFVTIDRHGRDVLRTDRTLRSSALPQLTPAKDHPAGRLGMFEHQRER